MLLVQYIAVWYPSANRIHWMVNNTAEYMQQDNQRLQTLARYWIELNWIELNLFNTISIV